MPPKTAKNRFICGFRSFGSGKVSTPTLDAHRGHELRDRSTEHRVGSSQNEWNLPRRCSALRFIEKVWVREDV